MMMQAGHLDNKRTLGSIRRFAKEVYPAIKGLARTKSRPWVEAAE